MRRETWSSVDSIANPCSSLRRTIRISCRGRLQALHVPLNRLTPRPRTAKRPLRNRISQKLRKDVRAVLALGGRTPHFEPREVEPAIIPQRSHRCVRDAEAECHEGASWLAND